ncbi:flippase [Methanolobus tindarius]|nr:flippase [Methanolobus tindarius]
MKDVQWSFISLITASLSHLLLRILLGNELGPSGLGLYTLVFTIYMFGVLFASFGIGDALTRYVAEFSDNTQKAKEYITSGIIGSVFSGFLMGVLLFLLSDVISINIFNMPEMANMLKITAICFPFIAINKTVVGSLNGFRNMKAFAFLNISLNMSIFFISILMVLYLKMGVLGAVLGFVIPTIIICLISINLIRSYLVFPSIFFTQNDAYRDILHFGFYAVLGNSILYVYTHIDSLMIGYYLDEAEVGLYAISVIFVQGLVLIPSAIQKVTSPIIAKAYAEKEYKFISELIKRITFKVFVISSLLSLLVAIFGKVLIMIIFEDIFLPAYLPLLIMLIGYAIYSTFISIGSFYSSIGYVQLSYKIALFSAILSIMLNIIFIPRYGIVGAAIATTTSLVTLTLLHFFIIKHLLSKM